MNTMFTNKLCPKHSEFLYGFPESRKNTSSYGIEYVACSVCGTRFLQVKENEGLVAVEPNPEFKPGK